MILVTNTDQTGEDEPEAFNNVYGRLDSSADLTDTMHNALQAAADDGFHVESSSDRMATIDACLSQAFEEMDSDGIDPETVLSKVESAAAAGGDLLKGLGSNEREFELPDHVSSGSFDTLGGYTEHLNSYLYTLRDQTRQWVDERG